MDSLVTDLLDRPHVFVDDSLIAARVGLERKVHQLTRHAPQPVLQTTEPWEGALTVPCSVIHDPAMGLWRMWYGSFGDRGIAVPGVRGKSMHAAVSDDGLHWRKPSLGVCRVNGNADNNLCAWEDGSPVSTPRAVFLDEQEPDPTRRYKLITYNPSYYLAYSADGHTWRPAQKEPVWPNGAGDGLEETSSFFHDPLTNRYRGYMRIWRRHQTIRLNGMGESDDLIRWSGPKICLDAQPHYGPGAQVYGMLTHVDAGLYWGMPWVFYTNEALDPDVQQTIRLRLAWSRDGMQWNPIAADTDLLPMGQRDRDFDWGMIISQCPVVSRGNENYLYYCGMDGDHTAENEPSLRAVGLAQWRKGGLVGLVASGKGQLLTRRFVMRGSEIRINAKVNPGGGIRADLLDDSGNTIKTASFARSDAFRGDHTDHPLQWQGSSDLSHLVGQYIMLRLHLQDAEVFSFRLHGSPEDFKASQGPTPVTVRRCVQPPAINGILDDTCWQDFNHTGVVADFVGLTPNAIAPIQTRVLITCDQDHLYLGIDCDEPQSAAMPESRKAGPVSYAREECVEIRMAGPEHGAHIHQFLITPQGGADHNLFSKEEGGLTPDFPGPWQVKTHRILGRWMIEAAIPFATLKTQCPSAGQRWKFNVIRYRHLDGKDTRTSWCCVFGSVHRSDLMGQIIFA